MPQSEPKSLLKAVDKACRSAFPRDAAIADHTWVPAALKDSYVEDTTEWRCDICGKLERSKEALLLHQRTIHEIISPMHACIDSPLCTICLVLFPTMGHSKRHVIVNSEICRYNLMLRGAFLNDVEVAVLRKTGYVQKREDKYSSKYKQVCCRVFGPSRPVYSLEGSLVQPYRANPLGDIKQPQRLPSHLFLVEEPPSPSVGCAASLYKACTGKCLLCRGGS